MLWPPFVGLRRLGAEVTGPLAAVADGVPCDRVDLACLIELESARTWSPSVRNPGSSAVGLLQWTRVTAEALGVPYESIGRMTVLQQIQDLIPQHFAMALRGRSVPQPISIENLYLCVAAPAFVGASPERIAYAGTACDLNAGWQDDAGRCTVGAIGALARRVRSAADARAAEWWDDGLSWPAAPPSSAPSGSGVGALVALCLAFGGTIAALARRNTR